MASSVSPNLPARRLTPLLTGLFALVTTTCARPPADPRVAGSWSYEVTAPESGSSTPRTLVVEATFDRAMTDRIALAAGSTAHVDRMEEWTGAGYRTVVRRDSSWLVPSCVRHCTIRYRIDLDGLASSGHDDVDAARRVGPAILSPSLAWLAHPTPKTDVPAYVRVKTSNAAEFASGMHADPNETRGFRFRSFDLDEGSFTAFGPMRHAHVRVASDTRARIDVAVLGDTKYAMTDEDMRAWISDAADVVTPLFGRFPVDQTTLFVVPAPSERDVVFGKVLSLAGASVVLVVGDKMPASATHSDWVLVHELFHLGFPTFRGEGRWLGEGLATYYEPILRARAGWLSDADVYREFVRNLPRGLPRRGPSVDPKKPGQGPALALAARDDLDSIYWGGALFCFAADVRIREVSGGKHSLDDVVRSTLARGGNATTVWTVADVVRVGDEITGTNVLSTMYQRYALSSESIDLDRLLASLGIERDEGDAVRFDESRPLAWVRHGIVDSGREARIASRRIREVP